MRSRPHYLRGYPGHQVNGEPGPPFGSWPAQIERIAKLVILASELRFQIKEIQLWLIHSLKGGVRRDDGGESTKAVGVPVVARLGKREFSRI
jgi:hypothetical protein